MRNVHKYTIWLLLVVFSGFKAMSQDFFKNGVWLKYGVATPGIQSIALSQLEAEGLDVSDPTKIAVYGGRSEMYPQKNEDNTQFSPEMVNSWISNNQVQGDALYFYSRGAVFTSYNPFSGLNSVKNIYTDTIYYYITISPDAKRIETFETLNTLTSSDSLMGYNYYEKDEVNLLGSGRNWYSNKITPDDEATEINFNLVDYKRELQVKYQVVGSSSEALIYSEIGTKDSVFSQDIIFKTSSGYGTKARSQSGQFNVPDELVSQDFVIKHGLKEGASKKAELYLDYVALSYVANHSRLEKNKAYYSLENSQNAFISSFPDASECILLARDLDSKTEKLVTPLENRDSLHFDHGFNNAEMILFERNAFYSEPVFKNQVDNFDLTTVEGVELLIVYYEELFDEVDRLVNHKRSLGLKTAAVDINQIKDHYSSGSSDVSGIRNYIKYVYETSGSLKYLLLIGDCSFDYKDRFAGNTNYVPVYQSRESFHNVQTFSSDDFYGFLDPKEGEWVENSSGNHTLNISVGRIPAQSLEEAQMAVNKIIFYETDNSSSSWKNNIVFVADDKDNALHVNQVNELIDRVKSKAPFIRDKKIYVDAYDRSNNDVSAIREDLIKSIEDGAMVVNFTGHGTEFIWTEEEILTLQTVKDLDNSQKLPLFVTATCEFGRYDDPRLFSGAESLLLNQAGAIGLVTTTRPVYASSNFTINKAFYDELFRKENGLYRSLGDVFRATKNSSLNSVFNRNFSLLGDPSLRLSLPESDLGFETINGDSANIFRDTIALGEPVDLKLHVNSFSGIKDETFNGTATISVFDQPQLTSTKGKDGQPTVSFTKPGNVIYEVNVEVVNGEINTVFSLPYGINPAYRKVSLIAYASNQAGRFAYGAKGNLVIGGQENFNQSGTFDMQVDLTRDNQNNQGKYSSDAELVFDIKDNDGILFSPILIGKEPYYILDDDASTKGYISTRDFMLEDGTNSEALLNLQLDNLTLGKHKISLYLFDSYGEIKQSEFKFVVGRSMEVSLFPNPVSNELFLDIDRFNDSREMDYTVQLFSIYGQEVLSDSGEIDLQEENGKQLFSGQLENISRGIYNYSILIRYSNGIYYEKTGQLTKL